MSRLRRGNVTFSARVPMGYSEKNVAPDRSMRRHSLRGDGSI